MDVGSLIWPGDTTIGPVLSPCGRAKMVTPRAVFAAGGTLCFGWLPLSQFPK